MYLIHILILFVSILCGWAFSRWLVKLAYLRGYRDGLRRSAEIISDFESKGSYLRTLERRIERIAVEKQINIPSSWSRPFLNDYKTSVAEELAFEVAKSLIKRDFLTFVVEDQVSTLSGSILIVRASILAALDPDIEANVQFLYQKPEIFRPDRPITTPPCPNHK